MKIIKEIGLMECKIPQTIMVGEFLLGSTIDCCMISGLRAIQKRKACSKV
jgi:hypothetical protein